ncbi:hypothetical protein AAHE18_01G246000 [Arachis hypogaea]
MAIQAVSKMAGCSETAAKSQFFLIDKDGLVTTDRNNLDPAAAPFAKNPRDLEGLTEGASIIEVVNLKGSLSKTRVKGYVMILKTIILVKKVRPHVLLGLSGVGGIFNEEVLKAMKESVSTKPAIFAMSSPTMNAECTAIDAFKHAGGDIVFGSGSPFENCEGISLLEKRKKKNREEEEEEYLEDAGRFWKSNCKMNSITQKVIATNINPATGL